MTSAIGDDTAMVERADFSGREERLRLYHGFHPAFAGVRVRFSTHEYVEMSEETADLLAALFEEFADRDGTLTAQSLEEMRSCAAGLSRNLQNECISADLKKYLRYCEPETLGIDLCAAAECEADYWALVFARREGIVSLYRAFFRYACEERKGQTARLERI